MCVYRCVTCAVTHTCAASQIVLQRSLPATTRPQTLHGLATHACHVFNLLFLTLMVPHRCAGRTMNLQGVNPRPAWPMDNSLLAAKLRQHGTAQRLQAVW